MQSLLQTKIWADFKAAQGWKSHMIELPNQAQPLSVLERPLTFGKSLAYAPEVTLPTYEPDQLSNLAKTIQNQIPNAIFFRLELFEPLGEVVGHTTYTSHATQGSNQSIIATLKKAGYQKAFEETQPEHRQWLDIAHDEAAIMAQMKEKGRYNIRLAERKGVTTRISTDIKDVEVFYQLFKETAIRDGFQIRQESYFLSLCRTLFEHNLAHLIIAEHDGQPLSALIITYYDGLASYLYGASSNAGRHLMGPYAAHWAAIKAAKDRGCKHYDLIQIAPPDASPNHKYTNLTRFKQQFGGQRVDLVGGWDFVYQPLWYQAFTWSQKIRRR